MSGLLHGHFLCKKMIEIESFCVIMETEKLTSYVKEDLRNEDQ